MEKWDPVKSKEVEGNHLNANHLNATNSQNFIEQFSAALSFLKESLAPSVQSRNGLI